MLVSLFLNFVSAGSKSGGRSSVCISASGAFIAMLSVVSPLNEPISKILRGRRAATRWHNELISVMVIEPPQSGGRETLNSVAAPAIASNVIIGRYNPASVLLQR